MEAEEKLDPKLVAEIDFQTSLAVAEVEIERRQRAEEEEEEEKEEEGMREKVQHSTSKRTMVEISDSDEEGE
eukprot:706110-Hanusia_phi.AAC.1